MKKLIVSLVAVVSLIAFTPAHAKSNVKVGMAFDQGFGVAAQFNNINAFIGNDGLSADYLFAQGSFGKDVPFNWFVGGGAYYNWGGSDNMGIRVPLGLTIPFAKKWDIYGQVSPELDYNLDHDDMNFELGFALGVRYAF